MWQTIEAWDMYFTKKLTRLWTRWPWFNASMIALAKYTPVMMLAVLVLAAFRLWPLEYLPQSATWSVASSMLSAIVIRCLHEPISRYVSRSRPFDTEPFEPLLAHDTGDSFPSNHSAGAMALAFGAVHLPGVCVLLLLMAIWLCFSRIYCGLHHTSDVLAGASGGMAVGVTFAYIQSLIHLA